MITKGTMTIRRKSKDGRHKTTEGSSLVEENSVAAGFKVNEIKIVVSTIMEMDFLGVIWGAPVGNVIICNID